MVKECAPLELADINTAGFLSLSSIPIELTNRDGRVFFLVPAEERTYRELARLQSNPMVPALDFISHLKRLRGRMHDARTTHEENGKRRTTNEGTTHR